MVESIQSSRSRLRLSTRWIVITGVIFAAVLLTAALSFRRAPVQVRNARAYRETITSSIATNGKIEPIDNFEAHAPMATTIRLVNIRQGDRVKPGQLLLQLDDANARSEAARARAQLTGAQADVSAVSGGGTQEELLTTRNALVKAQADRDAAQRNLQAMQRLLQTGAASQAEVDNAKVQLNIADANVHTLEQKLHDRFSKPEIGHADARLAEAQAALAAAADVLRNMHVASPLSGTVYNLPAKKDQFVAAGDLLVQVADLRRVRVRAFVDEPDIGRLQVGQPVEIVWDALPGRIWKGTIETLPSNVVQRGTRMVGEVTCILDNDDLKLLPNTNVSVAIIQARHENALTVPREAVREDGEGKYVFQVINGELKRRNVKTSVSNLTRVEITSGIPDNAVLALGAVNMQPLRDGMPVKNPT